MESSSPEVSQLAAVGVRVVVVNNDAAWNEMYSRLSVAQTICFDTETTCLDQLAPNFKVVGMSLAVDDVVGYYIPLNHRPPVQRLMFDLKTGGAVEPIIQLPEKWVIQKLKPILETKAIIGHGLKFDYKAMKVKYGVILRNIVYDTLCASHLLDERGSHKLKILTERYLGYKPVQFGEAIEDAEDDSGEERVDLRKENGFDLVPISKAALYAGPDAVNPIRLRTKFRPQFLQSQKLIDLLKMEIQLIPVTAEMDLVGTSLDTQHLARMSTELMSEAEKYAEEVRVLARNQQLNLASNKQMIDLVYGQMGIHRPRGQGAGSDKGLFTREARGRLTTAVREGRQVTFKDPKYRDKHGNPLVNGWTREDVLRILDLYNRWARMSKLESVYTTSLIDAVSGDGRLHTLFNQNGTNSGRFCVAADTPLDTSLGRFRISELDLTKNQNITILTHKGRMRRILNLFYKGKEMMYEVIRDDGLKIRCTKNHRFLTPKGWKSLWQIAPGEAILAVRGDRKEESIRGTSLRRAPRYGSNQRGPEEEARHYPSPMVRLPKVLSGEVWEEDATATWAENLGRYEGQPTGEERHPKKNHTPTRTRAANEAGCTNIHNGGDTRCECLVREEESGAPRSRGCQSGPTQTKELTGRSLNDSRSAESRYTRVDKELPIGATTVLHTDVCRIRQSPVHTLVHSRDSSGFIPVLQRTEEDSEEPYLLVTESGGDEAFYGAISSWDSARASARHKQICLGLQDCRNEPVSRGRRRVPQERLGDHRQRQEEGTPRQEGWVQGTTLDDKACRVRSKQGSKLHQISYIKHIREVGVQEVWDIEVEEDHSYVDANGFINHNSSATPNFQNIPRNTDPKDPTYKYDIRKAFRADPGWVYVLCDYSAMEMRICAAMSGDATMRGIVMGITKDIRGKPIDIHLYTACEAFQLNYDEVAPILEDKKHPRHAEIKEYRQQAKAVNFGLIYGLTEVGLAADLGTTVEFARGIINGFMRAYPGVAQWMKQTETYLRAQLYTETFMGRRRRTSYMEMKDPKLSGRAYRACLNHQIQGTGADIVKQAMINISAEIRRLGLRARIAGQIHDEIIIHCPREEYEEVARMMLRCMATEIDGVPITAEAEVKTTWSKLEESLWKCAA